MIVDTSTRLGARQLLKARRDDGGSNTWRSFTRYPMPAGELASDRFPDGACAPLLVRVNRWRREPSGVAT
jgi:hypothetical protein